MDLQLDPTFPSEIHEASIDECEAHVAELEGLVAHLSAKSSEVAPVAIIVHEVAQPVTAATNFLSVAEQILSKDQHGDAQGRALEAVRYAKECLTRTREVLASVAETAEGDTFDPRPQQLDQIVADAVRMLPMKATLTCTVDMPPYASKVMGDGVQLGQVVSNLLKNAMEATEGQEARLISIVSRLADEDLIEIRITDNGPGVPAEMEGRLFSAFASTKLGGAGVGLSICRAIVERHHGRIWAEALPIGAAFCFAVPRRGRAPRPGASRKRRADD